MKIPIFGGFPLTFSPGDGAFRVLDLGAGCGLVAAVACRVFGAAATTTAADGPAAVRRRLAETAALNERRFEVRKITWGNSVDLWLKSMGNTLWIDFPYIGNSNPN